MAYIYKTTNILNDKIYIGQTIYDNSNYYGSGKYLKTAIKKYGIENFKKEIIDECDFDELNDREIYWIDFYDSIKNGYNISKGGQKSWMTGLNHSEESRQKMSINRSGELNPLYGKHHTEETKKKISNSNKGKIRTDEQKEKLKGRKITEESRQKMSLASTGRKHTEESKNKLSVANKGKTPFLGKKHTQEWKDMISFVHKGKIVSDETKEKMRLNNIGKKLTEEQKNKIRASLEKEVVKIEDDNVVNVWKSLKDASLDLKISIKCVGYNCRKKDKNNKYKIMYKKDYEQTN